MQAMLGAEVTMMCEAESLPAESRHSIKEDSQAVGRRKAQAGEAEKCQLILPAGRGSGKSPKEAASAPDL